MIMRLPIFIFICFYTLFANAQSYRGMSVTGRNSAWISGSKGMVLRTNNGGKRWDTIGPKHFQGKDFRDIHAFNHRKAIIMSSGDSGVVLQTGNGGQSWDTLYTDYRPGAFLDAFDVRKHRLLMVGDGIPSQKMYIYQSLNIKSNNSFTPLTIFAKTRWEYFHNGYAPDSTSSYYAASGSNVQWCGKTQFYAIPIIDNNSIFISARGNLIRFFRQLPFQKQKAGGAYGFHMSGKNGVAVGGSFYKPEARDSVACYTNDGGKTWTPCSTMPGGYRSGVCSNKSGKIWICTGPNGSDYSTDGGKNWKPLFYVQGFNVCSIRGNYLWISGKASARIRLKDLLKVQREAEIIRSSPRGIPPRY